MHQTTLALLQLLASDLAQAAQPAAIAPALNLAPAPTPAGLGLGTGWIRGALVIAALGVAILWMRQHQKTQTRHLRVIETCGLGPKRQVALVLYGKRALLLASTDAGITLIDSQAASAEMLDADLLAQAGLRETAETAVDPFEAMLDEIPEALSVREKPAPRAAARRAAAFDSQLSDAEETVGLRRKLAELGSHP